MSIISVNNLTFSYDGSYGNIFENVSFQIDSDWKLGFIGRNGRGKTTFLRLLLGELRYSGNIQSSEKFEYFPYEVADKSRKTFDVMAGICPECMEWQIKREIALLEVSGEALERPFETLSEGERTKVLLAALFLASHRFLLLDEPTNHLDVDARKAVRDYLASKKGFILISHDRDLLDACVDHILSINKANIEVQKGNFSSWWENKNNRDDFERDENRKLKREIFRLGESAKRTAGWADTVEKSKRKVNRDGDKPLDKGFIGHQSAKAMKRAKSIATRKEAAAEEKSKLLHNIERYDDIKISPIPFHKERMIDASHLSLFYGDRKVVDDISFTVHAGERVAITGRNGSGKSSMLKLICGQEISHEGTLKVESGLVISLVPQDTSHLCGSIDGFVPRFGPDGALFRAILNKLDFSQDEFDKNLEELSEGQKKKVLIAKSLCEKAHLYVWDEPLNFIDVFSRMQIEKMILSYQPTLLFVEHDEAFRRNIATEMIEL
ncbi:MAG: ABC-F type ribosomal protection protein [Oscillospiraceae bacterium]|nr:ABC-F type ribosomal protection protein [Oscillospiraceae bacterium]